jgi:hypothetical protein
MNKQLILGGAHQSLDELGKTLDQSFSIPPLFSDFAVFSWDYCLPKQHDYQVVSCVFSRSDFALCYAQF